MKKYILILLMSLGSISVFAADWTSSVDSAESTLRIILNKPARGKFPSTMITNERKLEAMGILMNLEMRHPGLLKGKLNPGFDWDQYNEVKRLFLEFEKSMGFHY